MGRKWEGGIPNRWLALAYRAVLLLKTMCSASSVGTVQGFRHLCPTQRIHKHFRSP
jgi:hypothetical protein